MKIQERTETLEKRLTSHFKKLADIAFNFVGNNKRETNLIYIYGAIGKTCFYNVHYVINGIFTKPIHIDKMLLRKVGVSKDNLFSMLKKGSAELKTLVTAFESFYKETGSLVPTLIKQIYNPQTGALTKELIYEPQYSVQEEKNAAMAFEEWVNQIQCRDIVL